MLWFGNTVFLNDSLDNNSVIKQISFVWMKLWGKNILPFPQVCSIIAPLHHCILDEPNYSQHPSPCGEHSQPKKMSYQTLHIQLTHHHPQGNRTTVMGRLTWSSCSPDFILLSLNFYHILHQLFAAVDVKRGALMCTTKLRLQREPRRGVEI